jgi:hypothetical protein
MKFAQRITASRKPLSGFPCQSPDTVKLDNVSPDTVKLDNVSPDTIIIPTI